jgi:putative oxidoreductase
MREFVWRVLLAQRVHGRTAIVISVIRVVVGALFVFAFSLSKFTNHANEVRDFKKFGVPAPEVSTYVAGTVELVGGVLLLLGLGTRLGALMIGGDMVVAVVTAGRNEGGPFHLIVAPLVLLSSVVVILAGPTRWSVDAALARHHRNSTK